VRITLRQLECFVAVCDEGRVTAAAERLHLGDAPALLYSRRSYGRPALVAAR
jgi:DNA-binding transcriptional LysR family regulator